LKTSNVGVITSAPPEDGSIVLSKQPLVYPEAPVSVTIGGKAATLIYSGAALYKVAGTLKINAIIPKDIPSGLQPVVLKIGDNDNSTQNVTVFIQ
jgi:uncharacterized protein (TIGR03437 family)